MTPGVAVIICCHLEERADDLFAALEGLQHQTVAPAEVVVVVDNNPALAARARAFPFAMGLISLEQGGGLAVARNAGVAASRSEIVLFLDDDAIPAPDWVQRLTQPFKDRSVLGVSGFSEPLWPAQEPGWMPPEFLWTVGCSYAGQPTTRTNVRNVYGGCCGLRRRLFTELEGYDPRLGRSANTKGGGEEAELCLRARTRWPDGIFVYDPRARIQHRVTHARLTLRYLIRRCYDEGLMKAAVARMQQDALNSERDFATQLPRAAARHVWAGMRGDPAGFVRAWLVVVLSAAVVGGLGAATFDGWRTRVKALSPRPRPSHIESLQPPPASHE